MTDRPSREPRPPTVEPVDSVAAALDQTMPVLVDLDPDWQSRWSTAALFIEALRERGYTVARTPPAAPLDARAEVQHALDSLNAASDKMIALSGAATHLLETHATLTDLLARLSEDA